MLSGGIIAFTDWIEGARGPGGDEAERFCRFMKFPGIQGLKGYEDLLRQNGCEVRVAEDTGRFALHVDVYLNMPHMQLACEALRIVRFDRALMESMATEMAFMQKLAHAGKIAQGLFVARRMPRHGSSRFPDPQTSSG